MGATADLEWLELARTERHKLLDQEKQRAMKHHGLSVQDATKSG